MKRLLFAALLLLCTPAHAYVDEGLVPLYRAQMESDLVKLDFPCAENFEQSPDEDLVKTLNQYWDDLRNDKEVPDEDIACRLRALVKRGHIDRDLLTLYAYGFHKIRPDYAIYFFTILERDRPHADDSMLAALYAREGALQDIPRATSMFRADASALLSSTQSPKECAANLLSMRHGDNFPHPLYNEQMEWAASLCFKSSEYLSRLAEDLGKSESVDDRITSRKISLYLTGRRLFRPQDMSGNDR